MCVEPHNGRNIERRHEQRRHHGIQRSALIVAGVDHPVGLRLEVGGVLGKCLGDNQDAPARAKCQGRLRRGVGIGSDALVELMQPRDRDRTVSLHEGLERGVELRDHPKARSRVAKLDDVAAD